MSIVSNIRTTDERDQLKSEVELLLTNLYEHKGSGLMSALKNQVRSWVAEEIQNQIPADQSSVEGFLKKLLEDLTKLKVFKLKIAFEPTNSSIDKFIGFIRKNVGENVILEFEIDPKIYGGAEITFQGEYRDFSLKRLFEEEYKAKESELMKIVSPKQ